MFMNKPSSKVSAKVNAKGRKTICFVSRHPGAQEWLRDQIDLPGDCVDVLTHLDVRTVQPGDLVIGTLPVQLIASICARGARYLHIAFDMPPSKRGQELSAAELVLLHARLVEFRAQAIASPAALPFTFALDAARDMRQ